IRNGVVVALGLAVLAYGLSMAWVHRSAAKTPAAPPKPRAAAPEAPDDAHDAAPPAAKSSRKRSP
ncbi:hypothetical protein QZM99_33605, partial [Burkholderia gladioli]|nr:hypothetical protein [Burkholderia gladioli]